MASLVEVCEALADTIGTVDTLNTSASVPAVVNTPAAVVTLPTGGSVIQYDTTQSGQTSDVTLTVTLVVQAADFQAAEALLKSYLDWEGPSSVKAAVDANPTLGGVVDYAAVTDAGNVGAVSANGVDYLGADLTVTVGVSI